MFRIFDTETASLSGGVVEIAWINIDKDLNVLSQFRSLVNPERPIELAASGIHGIYDDDVQDAPKLADLIPAWGTTPVKVIAHNATFDVRMVFRTLPVEGSLCTLALSRHLLPEAENHRLQTIRQYFSLPENTAHSAVGDVETTLGVLRHLVELSGVDLTTLYDRAQEPKMLTKMPFGIHKGKSIKNVPLPRVASGPDRAAKRPEIHLRETESPMIDKLELWQARANVTGQMAIAVHLEEIVEFLETLEFEGEYPAACEHMCTLHGRAMAHLSHLSNALKKNESGVRVKIVNREKFADAVGDQIVTAVAAGCRNGVNVSAVVEEINKSNWSKFDDNGMPIYDENGKIKKGPNYMKANLKGMY